MVHEKAVSLRQLRALAAVVRTGSLTAAAEALSVTPPAISTQLRTLEQNIGAPLLRRSRDGRSAPTAQGLELLAATQRVETALALCFRRIDALNAGKAGFVALGVVSTGKYFAPHLVALARDALPGVEIGLTVGNRAEIIDALADGSVDLAIMGRPPRAPLVRDESLGEHPYVLIAPPGHPLAGRCDVSPEALLEQTFLLREPGSGTRILTERHLDRLGDGRSWRSIELGTNETIKQAVIAGLGIAIISAHTVAQELESGRLDVVAAPGLPIMRRWFLIHRADAELTPAGETLRRFVGGLGGAFLPAIPQRCLRAASAA